MRFVYGSYSHAINSVYISQDTRERLRSPRGRVLAIRRRLAISGVLIASTQSSITAAMDQLASGYLTEGQGAGLLQDNGQPSHHYLAQNGSLAGVQVVSGPNFGETNGNAEYATGRSFSITLEAEYPLAQSDPILRYSEQIAIRGNSGAKLVMHEPNVGPPLQEQTRQRTKVIVQQRGMAVGYLGIVSPNPPLFPQYQSGETPSNSFGSAGRQRQFRSTEYPVEWSYTFELPHFPGALYPRAR